MAAVKQDVWSYFFTSSSALVIHKRGVDSVLYWKYVSDVNLLFSYNI